MWTQVPIEAVTQVGDARDVCRDPDITEKGVTGPRVLPCTSSRTKVQHTCKVKLYNNELGDKRSQWNSGWIELKLYKSIFSLAELLNRGLRPQLWVGGCCVEYITRAPIYTCGGTAVVLRLTCGGCHSKQIIIDTLKWGLGKPVAEDCKLNWSNWSFSNQ